MTIINLERDQRWLIHTTAVTPTIGASAGISPVNTDGVVGQRVQSIQSSVFTSTVAATYHNVGVLMLPPPDGDRVPYRFIADYMGPNFCRWSIGWFDAGSCGGCLSFGVGDHLDTVLNVAPLDSADPLYGRSLCLFASVANEVASSLNQVSIFAQRMIAKPPQFASAVS